MSDAIQIGLDGLNRSMEQLQSAIESIAAPTENSNLIEDIIELKVAARSYEANLAVIKAADDLAQATIDILIY